MPVKCNKTVLDNGISLIVEENKNLPIVSLLFIFKGGSVFENIKNQGITNLLLKAMLKGTKHNDFSMLSDRIEELGAVLEHFTARDFCGFKLNLVSHCLKMGFGILKEIIQTAELDPQEIEKEKKIIISEIKKRRDNTYARAVDLCESALFLPDAYGFSVFGCENSLKNISRDDLIDWKDKLFSSSDILLSVSGDTNIQEIKSLAETIYVNNKKNGLKCDNLISDKKRIIKKNEYICKKQAVVAIGYKTSKIKSKDFAGLEVLNNVLSGMGSRLFIRVRDDLGLAYTISSVYHAYFRSGSFMIYFGTSHEKYSKAIDVIFKELEILKKNVIDTDELKRSINYLLGTRHIDMQKNASRAFKYAVYELSGYGWQTAYNIENKFKNVSIKEIKRVAEKYFDLKNCVIAKILPEKK